MSSIILFIFGGMLQKWR